MIFVYKGGIICTFPDVLLENQKNNVKHNPIQKSQDLVILFRISISCLMHYYVITDLIYLFSGNLWL